ncbi:potassium-transporting ATPase subunit F [Mesobacillus zeae]|uniref:Potassium-transporting ATPase subunit F n=1 Tax=Mesobacillus zeae TaxID=1917180 RepID=A0A398BLP2_9BACI|nr:potassium-transporting ATPase subunit F [Mesobacillus zeae]
MRLDYQQGKERRKMTVLAVITGALSLYLLDALLHPEKY